MSEKSQFITFVEEWHEKEFSGQQPYRSPDANDYKNWLENQVERQRDEIKKLEAERERYLNERDQQADLRLDLYQKNTRLRKAGAVVVRCLKTLVGFDKQLGLDRTAEECAMLAWKIAAQEDKP